MQDYISFILKFENINALDFLKALKIIFEFEKQNPSNIMTGFSMYHRIIQNKPIESQCFFYFETLTEKEIQAKSNYIQLKFQYTEFKILKTNEELKKYFENEKIITSYNVQAVSIIEYMANLEIYCNFLAQLSPFAKDWYSLIPLI